jgi:hypothetical protein
LKVIRDADGKELATILAISEYANGSGSQFFSDPSESLQVGSLVFTEKDVVQPHIHQPKEVGTAYPIVEMILILGGSAQLDVYDEKKKLVETVEVSTGTLMLLKRGGHGYRFPEGRVRLLDVRCGPYIDKAHDKDMIVVKKSRTKVAA